MSGYQWKIGEKAVCVQDDWGNAAGTPVPSCAPKKGQVFTISDKFIDPDDGLLQLVFCEIDGWDWEAGCFRPLVKRKTDISIFRKMLKPQPETVDG